MKSDIEIAHEATLNPIEEIASKLGLAPADVQPIGPYVAKVAALTLSTLNDRQDGKLVLVTAMTPTPAGEGKTTTTIGLAQALSQRGQKVAACIREPSLGPVMGMKGGAAGGGFSQVLPMEQINLHFTGDLHAVTAAHNLLSAIIDNHIFQGNHLGIDPAKVKWSRVLDMNDRTLRKLYIGLDGSGDIARMDGFAITAASEVMAILCLAIDYHDLKQRLGEIIVAYTHFGEPIRCRDLGAEGAMAALLRDAFNPNLVQTIEGTPVFIHGGPFANIAHGCNSLVATKLALKLADVVVTEAGFGAELGAEKFFDIKCRIGALKPAAVVLVATVRAVKHHGAGGLDAGLKNLRRQMENVRAFGITPVVAVNRFPDDSDEDVAAIVDACSSQQVAAVESTVHADGGEGGLALADAVLEAASTPSTFHPLYSEDDSIEAKIEAIAGRLYGAGRVVYTENARRDLIMLAELGYNTLPVCMSKTQHSLSDDPKALGAPEDFTLTVTGARASAGAGFVVVFTGRVLLMPGLPKHPAALDIDVDDEGVIHGLF